MKREIREFSYAGRTLQISAEANSDGWKIRLFEGGRQVSPIVYSVSHETVVDAAVSGVPSNLVEGLIQLMRHDVENGILPLPPS
jgi:hypothetical protein